MSPSADLIRLYFWTLIPGALLVLAVVGLITLLSP